MKKLLLFAAAVLVALSSCEDPDKRYYDAPRHFETFTVYANQWTALEDGGDVFFEHGRSVPGITREAIRSGIVKMYVYVANGVQQELPYTRYYRDIDNPDKTYSTTIDYEFRYDDSDREGKLSIFFTSSDFAYFDNDPGKWEFRLVVFY